MNLLVPNSPVVPSFGASVGDNTMARLKDVNQVISAVNSITTDGYVPDKGNVTQTGFITTAVTTAKTTTTGIKSDEQRFDNVQQF